MLDEKQFYIKNKRQETKIKNFILKKDEKEGNNKMKKSQMRTCHFSIKLMLVRVVEYSRLDNNIMIGFF